MIGIFKHINNGFNVLICDEIQIPIDLQNSLKTKGEYWYKSVGELLLSGIGIMRKYILYPANNFLHNQSSTLGRYPC